MNVLEAAAIYDAQSKSQDFVRSIIAMAVGRDVGVKADQIFGSRWPGAKYRAVVQKAAVSGGLSTGWGSALVDLKPLAEAFLSELRPMTVIGRLQGVRPAPFNTPMAMTTAGTSVGWIGEGKPTAVSAMAFDRGILAPAKVGGIVVLTKELLLSANPSAEDQIAQDLRNAIALYTDAQFINPAVAENADHPASVTNGTTAIAASGTTAAAAKTDFKALVKKLTDAGVSFASPYFVMHPIIATNLAALDVDIFRDVGPLGGEIMGIPVLTSLGAGTNITLLDAADIILADDGVDVSVAEHASVEMVDNPTNDSGTPTLKNLVSLFQANAVGIMAIRRMRWRKRRAGAAAYISGAAYGG